MDEAKSEKPLSILERFRQLSKEKENGQVSHVKPAESVGAVYLNKNNYYSPPKDNFSKNEEKKFSEPSSSLAEKPTYRNEHNDSRDHNDRKRDFHSRRDEIGSNSQSDRKRYQRREEPLRRPITRDRTGAHIGLTESDVGITEFVSDQEGFKGILKQRFTDFNVNEISIDGTLVKLTTTEVEEEPPENAVVINDDSDLLEILPKEKWDELYSIVENEDVENSVEIEVTHVPKEERWKIHKAIKNLFATRVESNTGDVGDKKILTIRYNKGKSTARRNWKKGEYLHFAVHKENIDTTEVITILASKLKVKPSMILSCGTKDKRGATTQMMCIRRMMPDKVCGIQPLKQITLGNYRFHEKPLRLGKLKGNRFRIAIRNVQAASDSVITNAVTALKEKGFLNYFGLQRFGQSVLVPTPDIGKMLIRKNYKGAVELILKPRPGERTFCDLAEAREIWWETRNATTALKVLHWRNNTLEKRVLVGLHENGPNAYLNALECLPRNMLTFYCHAYQSLVWNKVVSRRVKEFGLSPIAGDIVLLKEDGSCPADPELEAEDAIESEEKSCKTDNKEESKTSKTDNKEESKNDSAKPSGSSSPYVIKILTESEAKETSIYDIVYPLPGHDISFPKNVIGEWYTGLLAEDDLTIELLRQTSSHRCLFSLYGTYRKMMAKPEDLIYSMVHYSDPSQNLLVSDVDALRGAKPVEFSEDGEYKALLLEFTLNPCNYATMALREMLKCETSSSFHASLTSAVEKSTKIDSKNADDDEGDKNEEETPKKKVKTETPEKKADENEEDIKTEAMDTESINGET